MASVISTVLSRLNAFLDSEMEQILCFDTAIDAEKFCNEKSAIFIVLPEEDQTKYFMVSLILQNLYRGDPHCGRRERRPAQEPGGLLRGRVGHLPAHSVAGTDVFRLPVQRTHAGAYRPEHYGTAAEKTMEKRGSEIIVDNCQVNLYGGFAPASQTAVELSKSLGGRTVMSGSISRGKTIPASPSR